MATIGRQRERLIMICFLLQTALLLFVFYRNPTQKISDTIDKKTSIVQNPTTAAPTQAPVLLNLRNLSSLYDIGTKHKTDKVLIHRYEALYEKYLSQYRNTNIRLLEIGLGCGMTPVGASAQTWREYLGPEAVIHMIEYDKTCGQAWENAAGRQININVHYGSQEDVKFLEQFKASQEPFHIIIDDGGHTMNQQKISFEILLPLVRPGGFYAIEDLDTSYITEYGGEYLNASTTIEFIKSLVDEIQPRSPKKNITLASQIFSFEIGDGICLFTKRST